MKMGVLNGGRAAFVATTLAMTAACGTQAQRVRPSGPLGCAGAPADVSYGTRVLNVLRVRTGEDGVSHAQVESHPALESLYLGALLRQFSLGDPSNVVIVSGPPNFHIPSHAAPYREIFVLLAGTSTAELSDGTRHELHAGSVILFEDLSGPGHAATFGPCGYVALDLQFKPLAAAPVE